MNNSINNMDPKCALTEHTGTVFGLIVAQWAEMLRRIFNR